MEFKNWSTYRIKELSIKTKIFFPFDSTDYHESKSDRLTSYIFGWGKYKYRNNSKELINVKGED